MEPPWQGNEPPPVGCPDVTPGHHLASPAYPADHPTRPGQPSTTPLGPAPRLVRGALHRPAWETICRRHSLRNSFSQKGFAARETRFKPIPRAAGAVKLAAYKSHVNIQRRANSTFYAGASLRATAGRGFETAHEWSEAGTPGIRQGAGANSFRDSGGHDRVWPSLALTKGMAVVWRTAGK
jgi:hypothetical protein